MKLSEYKASAARHILIYGPPKAGKTWAYGELAKKFRLHVIDIEDSVKSLMHLPKAQLDNIELIRLPDNATNQVGFKAVMRLFKQGKINVCHEHGEYQCSTCKKDPAAIWNGLNFSELTANDIVVIDSFSALVESVRAYIMKSATDKEDWDAKAGWDEYGKEGRILDFICSFIQTAPFHIIVTSHEQMVEMVDKSKKIVPIGGTSNSSKTFGKYFDDVVYMYMMNGKHKMNSSTVGIGNVLAGSRRSIALKEGDTLMEFFK